MKEKHQKSILLVEFFFLLFLDLLAKYIIRQNGGFYVCNYGISWGIKISNLLFILIWLILNLSLVYFFKKALNKENFFQKQFIILIFAGSIGNLIGRIYDGCVIDFIKIPFFNFPFFNFADTFIFTGCIFLIIHIVLPKDCE